MDGKDNIIKKNSLTFICLIGGMVALICALPYIILGEDAYIQINDYLDLTIPHIKSIKENHLFWDFDGIVPIMCGLKRSLFNFVSPVDLRTVLFMTLPTYWAIVANIFYVKLFAFIGMYYLLSEHVLGTTRKHLVFSLSVAFALIPFYVDYGLSAAGVPLVTFAFINLFKQKKLAISYLTIAFYGLNSILALSGIFVCFCVFAFIVISICKNRTIPKHSFWGLVLLSIIYVIVNYDLFLNFFVGDGQYVSHREEFMNSFTLSELLRRMFGVLRYSQPHAGNFLAFPIILVALFFLFKNWKKDSTIPYYFLGYCIFCLLCFVFTSLKVIPIRIFQTFQFDRLYFLYPTVVFIFFAKSLDNIRLNRALIGAIFVCLCFCTSFFNEELIWQINKYVLNKDVLKPSYKEFYDEKLFGKIKTEVIKLSGKEQPKVACLGFFPAIAQYNGIWTLDASLNNYPLSHKHKFSEILKNEVSKSNDLYNYFEKWGCRCYLFAAELFPLGQEAFLCSKVDKMSVTDFNPEVAPLKDMGCDFVLSSVSIDNIEQINGLEYVNSFTNNNSFWKIYIYRVL